MNLTSPQTLEVRVMGQPFTVRTGETDPVILKEISELVQQRISACESRLKSSVAPHSVLLLAFLDLAEEYIHAKHRTQDYLAKTQQKSSQLLSILDQFSVIHESETDTPADSKSTAVAQFS